MISKIVVERFRLCSTPFWVMRRRSAICTAGALIRAACPEYRSQGGSIAISQLGQIRCFDITPFIFVPGVVLYLRYMLWLPHRDAFNALNGTILDTEKFGKIQYNLTDPNKKLKEFDENQKSNIPMAQRDQDIILFFHGTPASCNQYTALSNVTSFNLPFPVISISRPGYVGTELAKRSTLAHVSDLHRHVIENELHLIDSINLSSPYSNRFHLLATHRGGLYALHFAHKFPNLVSSMTLMSASTRAEGFRLPLGNKGHTEYFEGDDLVNILWMELKKQKRILTSLTEMMTNISVKKGSAGCFRAIFRCEFDQQSQDELLPKLAISYSLGQFFNVNPILFDRHSYEFAFNMMEVFGIGSLHLKRDGQVNDLCNTCGVEVDIENVVNHGKKESFKAIWEIAKREAEKRALPRTSNFTSFKYLSYKEMLTSVQRAEKQLRNEDANISSKEVSSQRRHDQRNHSDLVSVNNQEFLSQIRCPTLIMHSPNDGKLSYLYHAQHAAQYLPNSKLETFDSFPHTLVLKDPKRVSSTITTFIHALPRQ